jgi:hypothetical protein
MTIQFLFIDNANYGSVVMDIIRNEFPIINKNLINKDLSFHLIDHPHIIERYIEIYLYIIYYFNQMGIPFSNMIFFRDCNHSANWRKKILKQYKEGKSRFADKETYEHFSERDELLKRYETEVLTKEQKYELEDKIDAIKYKVKSEEKFIHELASIERSIHFFLNDNICNLTERSCCEADEQMFVFMNYLKTYYSECEIYMVSNDTDLIQCLSSNEIVNKLEKIVTSNDIKCNKYKSKSDIKPKVHLMKCFKDSKNLMNFKNVKEIYKDYVLDNFLIHKVLCGKQNDNLPDPSNIINKQSWFGQNTIDIYCNLNINLESLKNDLQSSPELKNRIHQNIMCSSFDHIPGEIKQRIETNCASIINKAKSKHVDFKSKYEEDSELIFKKYYNKLVETVTHWLEENIVRSTIEWMLSDNLKYLCRSQRMLTNEEVLCNAEGVLQKYSFDLQKCKIRWLLKYIDLWFLHLTYKCGENEYNGDAVVRPLYLFIKPSYKEDVIDIQTLSNFVKHIGYYYKSKFQTY